MKPVIGILVHRENRTFSNSRFLRDLIAEGRRQGAHVYAFSHKDLLEKTRRIRGYVPDGSLGWMKQISPWPDIVIDFCRKLYKPFRDMRRRTDLFPYANHKFTYKWKAMKLFAETDEVSRWIPETHLYSPKQLSSMLRRHAILYVKPGNGTGGHSIAKVSNEGTHYVLQGRRKSGRLVKRNVTSQAELQRLLNKWTASERIRSGAFMIQQGLDLRLLGERLVDCRLLVQKNGAGEWEITGKVLRVGGKDSPTTNLLYRDGKAMKFRDFLTKRFDSAKAESLDRECDELAVRLMNVVEKRFGSMIEFGLDIGIDTIGRVWLIEANPKPSHQAFLHSNDLRTYRRSIQLPIAYAVYAAQRRQRPGQYAIREETMPPSAVPEEEAQ